MEKMINMREALFVCSPFLLLVSVFAGPSAEARLLNIPEAGILAIEQGLHHHQLLDKIAKSFLRRSGDRVPPSPKPNPSKPREKLSNNPLSSSSSSVNDIIHKFLMARGFINLGTFSSLTHHSGRTSQQTREGLDQHRQLQLLDIIGKRFLRPSGDRVPPSPNPNPNRPSGKFSNNPLSSREDCIEEKLRNSS